VYVHGLHEAEPGDHQHEQRYRKLPQRMSINLVEQLHRGQTSNTISKLDAGRAIKEQEKLELRREHD
jgi:hypothetical protein